MANSVKYNLNPCKETLLVKRQEIDPISSEVYSHGIVKRGCGYGPGMNKSINRSKDT